jgi:hypothetical protein
MKNVSTTVRFEIASEFNRPGANYKYTEIFYSPGAGAPEIGIKEWDAAMKEEVAVACSGWGWDGWDDFVAAVNAVDRLVTREEES